MIRDERAADGLKDYRGVVTRYTSFLGAMMLIVAALWSAGFPPSAWFRESNNTTNGAAQSKPLKEQKIVVGPEGKAIDNAEKIEVAGTDSSTSREPQDLLLIAAFPGNTPAEGTAQIGTDESNPQTYAAGSLLANGARIAEIHKDYVVLSNGPHAAKLYVKGRGSTQQKRALIQVGGSELKNAVPSAPPREVLTDYLRPSPVYEGEVLLGYQVYPGTRSGVFYQLGLQGGDLITAVDGQPLADPASAIEILRQITAGLVVKATISRNGKLENIVLDGSLVTADQVHSQEVASDGPAPPHMSLSAG